MTATSPANAARGLGAKLLREAASLPSTEPSPAGPVKVAGRAR